MTKHKKQLLIFERRNTSPQTRTGRVAIKKEWWDGELGDDQNDDDSEKMTGVSHRHTSSIIETRLGVAPNSLSRMKFEYFNGKLVIFRSRENA